MSDLNSAIASLVSALTGKTILAEETSVIAYTPKKDEDKKSFTKDDITWLIQELKSPNDKGGFLGFLELVGDKFNNKLKKEIEDAAGKDEDMGNVVKFLKDYITYDKSQKEFTKEDIKWLLQQIKSHSFSGGVKGLIKRMDGKYNDHLKKVISDAAIDHGDLEGVIEFLSDYDKYKDQLNVGKPVSQAPELDVEDTKRLKLKGESIKSNITKVKDYLKTVKEKHPKEYENSFYSHTEQVLSNLMKYLNSNEKSKKLENDFINLFVTDEINDAYGLLKGWKKLKVKGVTPAIQDIFLKIENYFEHPKEQHEKDILHPPKVDVDSLTTLEKAVHNLEKKRPKVEDVDVDINKGIKKDDKKDLSDSLKKIDKDEKNLFHVDVLNNYFEKAKKESDGKLDGLHKYTEDLIDAVQEYVTSNGRNSKLNEGILEIFKKKPGIINLWDKINGTVSSRLSRFITDFNRWSKQKDTEVKVDKAISDKLLSLSNRNVSLTEKDKSTGSALYKEEEKSTRKPQSKDIDKLTYPLDMLDEYFVKAKKSYPDQFDKSLHSYTKDLVDIMKKYIKEYVIKEEPSNSFNNTVKSIFEDKHLVKSWEEINKPISKRIKQFLGAFNTISKTKKDSQDEGVSDALADDIESLSNKDFTTQDRDRAITKGLSGKKERTKLVLPEEIDTEMYNKVLKHLVKNIEDLPKIPKKKDFIESLSLNPETPGEKHYEEVEREPTEMEKKLFEKETIVTFFSKVVHLIDDIKNDKEDISDADIVSEVKKLIEESGKPKPHVRKDVLDRDIPKEQEESKNKKEEDAPQLKKKKESSTNIVNGYMGTLFYKIENIANNSPDKLVKAELESIAEDIRRLF